MKVNGPAIYGTRGGCIPPQSWGVTTQKENTLYIHILNNVEDGQIFLPLTEQKLTKVTMFADDTKLKFKRDEEGYRIFLPKLPETVDCILEATIKPLSNSPKGRTNSKL